MPAGAIIAGGESTRFGDADKAVADLAGTPMIRRVADRLVGVVDALVVNCRADQWDAIAETLADYPLPVSYAIDPEPDQGPMAGIRTALRGVERDTDAEYAFVAACDMPFLDADVVDLLFERAAGHDAAVPRPDEWYETTHAVYRAREMADACDAALARSEGKILAPLEALDWVVVEESALRERGSIETFRNVNTREKFERAVRDLA
ncbi:molybdenum cofactor guanylyltransferase [Halorarius litoreus]|uniref:molybdenum cofactor guanylyltransferase n=1 Tax=Halorarius litoreus TaxID=2962676 RepID=UPI0020CD9016|nr:molybdenum cofactor guanylyltransferase [Halorarius litoreus]